MVQWSEYDGVGQLEQSIVSIYIWCLWVQRGHSWIEYKKKNMRDFEEKYTKIFSILYSLIWAAPVAHKTQNSCNRSIVYDSEKGGFAEIEWMKIDYGILKLYKWFTMRNFLGLSRILSIERNTVYRNSIFNGSK